MTFSTTFFGTWTFSKNRYYDFCRL